MLKHRLFSVVVSTLAFLLLAGVIAQGLAVFETRITDTHDASLQLARDSIEASIEDSAREAEGLANHFSDDVDMAEAFVEFERVTQKGQGARNKGKLDDARAQIDEFIISFRNDYSTVSGVSLMNFDGMIQVAQSNYYSITQRINFEENPFIKEAMKGEASFALVSADGVLRFVGAAPVWDADSDDPVAIALVEHVIRKMPVLPQGMVVVVAEGKKASIGKLPSGVTLPTSSNSRLPVRVGSGDASSVVVGPVNKLPIDPLFVNRDAIGVMAVSFVLPGQTGLTGWVFSDSSLIFGQLGGAQITLIGIAGILWLLHIVMFLFGGGELKQGIEELSDYIASSLQGVPVAKRPDPDSMPAELDRLTVLVGRLADRPSSAAQETSVDRAPDFTSLLIGGDNPSAPDFASLELEGLLENRTVQLDNLAFAPMEIQGQAQRATIPVVNVVGATPSRAPATPEVPDGSITRPFIEQEAQTVVAPKAPPHPPAAAVEVPGPLALDGLSSSPAYDTISGFLAQVPEVPNANSVDDDPFVSSPDDWSDVTLEPLPDFENQEEATIVDQQDTSIDEQIQHLTAAKDGGATSVMRVSPELMEKMRARDPELANEPVDQTMQMQVIEPEPLDSSSDLKVQSLNALMTGTATKPAPVPPPSMQDGPVKPLSDEERSRLVFDNFVAMRKKCGEDENVSFNKFKGRLDKSRQMVIEKHQCKDVSFRVYEKNGRAALKATPIH
ncbi:MAG: cache domain-containing protein [Deltaproteobacteria bacterium]|nr:cache domain-containing protein [Deltaproteobacteria bacterium]MBT6490337.1 cache domain-containing protein [Deltaproteobacteria bacterium]